jgi:Flp pilus assembly protein TadD
MERGEYADAIRLWRDALRKNPGLVLVRTNLALALLRTGDRVGAEAELAMASAFEPGLAVPDQLRRELR